MKHYKSFVGLALLAMAALSGCKSEEERVINMLPTTRSIELTDVQREFVNKNNDFSFNFFRSLSENELKGKSSVVSPLSATFVLGMLNDGAAGHTAHEIASVLGFGEGAAEDVNAFCRKLIEELPQVDPSVEVEIANLLIANSGKDVRLASQFRSDMEGSYHASVSANDFSNANFLGEINGWCSDHTHGMIPEILSEKDLKPEFVVMLLNAIYYKATWTNKFDLNDTHKENFTVPDGSVQELPLMHRKAWARYGQNDIYSTLYLPYGTGDRWSMMLLLPNEGKTTADIISNLDNASWEKNLEEMWEPEVDIKIPRFTTQTDTDLKETISRIGAPSMFDPEKAEFPKMCDNDFERVWVGLMKQKAIIEVNEEGTKASAVTVTAGAGESYVGHGDLIERPMKVDFHCNRPFVYLIREATSGTIFFIGTFQGN